jgi:hypothetical protein
VKRLISRVTLFDCAESSPNSLVERVQDIYASVLESEECLERVACEVGGMVEDMGVNKSMLRYFFNLYFRAQSN